MKSKDQPNYQQAKQDLITVGDWIRYACSQFQAAQLFYGHGTDNAWDEAVQLVLGVLRLPLDGDKIVFHAKLTGDERDHLAQILQARIEARKPMPYLTNEAWFMGMPFYVDERVLIPRSPFGEWIEKQFVPWVDPDHVNHILEIGTGSACMAIACALSFEHAQVDAVDIDKSALAVAKINVERYELDDRVRLVQSDCFAALGDQRYDLIISNPPYVSAEEMSTLPPEYSFEPKSALEADDDGLSVALKILRQAERHLNPHGVLIIEVGNSQYALAERFPEVPWVWLEQERGGHGLFLLTKEDLKHVRQ